MGVYRHEIENSIPNNSPAGENADMNVAPQCYTGGTLSDPTMNSDPNDPLGITKI